MSDWYLPRPDQKYMDRAWEKNPLMKKERDRAAYTDTQKELFTERSTEWLHGRLCFEYGQNIELRATIYALWLEHRDEMERYRAQVYKQNEKAWNVLQKVADAQRAGRKTVRIDDLMEGTSE